MTPLDSGAGLKRVLVTGASGFVGRRLTPRLAAMPDVERILPIGGTNLVSETPWVDLRDADGVARMVADFAPTDIVHLAAASSVAGAGQAPEMAWDVNLVGVRNLASAVRRLDAPARLLFASTAEVYGKAFLNGPCAEDTPPQPVSAYARTKLAAEYLLEDLSGNGMKVTVLRLFNHTGPGQDTRFVVPAFAAQIAALETDDTAENTIHVGNLEASRDFTDIDDIVSAYAYVVDGEDDGPDFVRFNVGSGRVRTIKSILDQLVAKARRPIRVELDPARLRPAEIRVASGVFDAFRARYGWVAETPFERTVDAVLADQRSRLDR